MSEKTRNSGRSGPTGKTSKDSTGRRKPPPNPASTGHSSPKSRDLAGTDKSNRPENKPWRMNMRASAGDKKLPESNNHVSPQKSAENDSSLSPKPWENYRAAKSSENKPPAVSPKTPEDQSPPLPPPKVMEIEEPPAQPRRSPPPPEPQETNVHPLCPEPAALPPAPSPLASPAVEKLSLDPPVERNVEFPTREINGEEERIEDPSTPEEEEENGVRMRQRRVPPPRVINGANGAIARGLDALAESEMEENLEEIKRLDTQLDHLNECLDQVEDRINRHNTKIQDMLTTQKTARLQRRASFQQRVTQSQQEDEDFHAQVRAMLSRCGQSRRASVPVFPDELQDIVGISQAASGVNPTSEEEGN